MLSPTRRWLLTAAGILLFSCRLAAHDFWIEPSSFESAVGQPVRIHLRVGEHFAGDPVKRNDRAIERFVLAGPGEERPVAGRQGMDPAGVLRLEVPGIYYVAYRSKPSATSLSARAFEQYLAEEGLESIIEERRALKESATPARELFSRSVKTLLRTTGAAGEGWDHPLNMTLEFVPQADPAHAPDGRLPVRLLLESTPLPGALVVAYRKDDSAASEGREVMRGRTDAAGEISIPVGPGVWLLKAVHMKRAPAGSEADWQSTWTALTFQIP